MQVVTGGGEVPTPPLGSRYFVAGAVEVSVLQDLGGTVPERILGLIAL